MNKRQIKYLLVFSFILVLAGAACKGPTGSTGPEGPPGPQGEQGTMGEPGNANIMYSEWMDIEWREEASNNTIKQMPIFESRITEGFLDEGGIVLMFMQFKQSNGIVVHYTLPWITGSGGKFQFLFNAFAGHDEGGITFMLVSLDKTTIPDDLWENYEVRYVLIPGSVNLAAKGVKWGDYETIVKYYGIPK